jgi:hypothetical protein
MVLHAGGIGNALERLSFVAVCPPTALSDLPRNELVFGFLPESSDDARILAVHPLTSSSLAETAFSLEPGPLGLVGQLGRGWAWRFRWHSATSCGIQSSLQLLIVAFAQANSYDVGMPAAPETGAESVVEVKRFWSGIVEVASTGQRRGRAAQTSMALDMSLTMILRPPIRP